MGLGRPARAPARSVAGPSASRRGAGLVWGRFRRHARVVSRVVCCVLCFVLCVLCVLCVVRCALCAVSIVRWRRCENSTRWCIYKSTQTNNRSCIMLAQGIAGVGRRSKEGANGLQRGASKRPGLLLRTIITTITITITIIL